MVFTTVMRYGVPLMLYPTAVLKESYDEMRRCSAKDTIPKDTIPKWALWQDRYRAS
jgi:hypothetical protein